MPSFNFIKKTNISNSFRDKSTFDKYDLNNESLKQTFSGTIEYPENWNIGLIVGASGTGKTSILKELYSYYIDDYIYNNNSVLDNMPKNVSLIDIYKTFNSVGFSSPPSWLKSYNVLSNGEKMRVNLARAILLNKEIIVFDEFTSVVDRQVAKIGSFAVQKSIRRLNKKFIAFSCHYDIEDWLMPDFLFSTDTMKTVYKNRRLLQRPTIDVKIYSIDKSKSKYYWNMFKKYHYLNRDINVTAKCFLMTCNNIVTGFTSYVHFPHNRVKTFKRLHRTVIMPDWQGIGLSNVLYITVGDMLLKNGFRVISTTTNPALCNVRKKSSYWKLTRIGRVGQIGKTSKISALKSSLSMNRITTSWEYIGNKSEVKNG